jgi:putative DNA primase/helicase
MSFLEEEQKRARGGGTKKRARKEPSPNGEAAGFIPGDVNYTDLGNARRLVAAHGQDFRHCFPWKKDLVWDGKVWREDDTGQLERWAKDTVRRMYQLAAATLGQGGGREGLVKHALKSEEAKRLRAMVSLARSEPGIPVLPSELDRDPWLLNCPNGTADLRTGRLQPHRREDYLTKLCPVEYHSEAPCPAWETFLAEVFPATGDAAEEAGNAELIGFLRRVVGYCLTADVREQVLLIFWGTGANGKSTFLNVLLDLLGEGYALKAPADLLMVKREAHPTEKAGLFGKRLVVANETEAGGRLAESLAKELTGGDPITARRMREDFWTFRPTFKLVLCSNHKPVIKGTDHAVWRRVRLVPFAQVFPPERQDRQLPERLKAELPGILAWAVRGCLEWQRNGLGLPEDVRAATEGYRGEQDLLGAFLAECCVTGDSNYRCKAGDLYARFRAWCEAGGERDVPRNREFGQCLTERGFERFKSSGIWYRGVALAQGEEREEREERDHFPG